MYAGFLHAVYLLAVPYKMHDGNRNVLPRAVFTSSKYDLCFA